ncbi:MAG TPA: ABC transporter ATP-binding protein [Candidatus Binatia bacterium]|nr:ABC transporter ATP-binding protein [Candidatus Binatia bacterium]
MNDHVLQVHSLTRSFGGLVAVDHVSLDVVTGELHAVIGPNGAGKTTLINLLSGELEASSGRIIFQGDDVSRLPPEVRSRRGIGRSYQKTNIFLEFSALENCRLAAQSREQRPVNWLRDALSYNSVVNQARRVLDLVGLLDRAGEPALALSHGEQRQLEIAMCLVTAPTLLLLDEPLAGMGTEESLRMVDLIRELSQTHAILLVEHDMDAVFQLARVLTVMVDGKVLTSGTPEEVRRDRQVQAAYLGNPD